MRGKVKVRYFTLHFWGITPACAGKSAENDAQITRCGDHPRVCGEKAGSATASAPCSGSPPRVRGKDDRHRQTQAQAGITPACAGKSSCGPKTAAAARDHPRVCGEKVARASCAGRFLGSPPRVRGKVRNNSTSSICARDHPRVCGEKKRHLAI